MEANAAKSNSEAVSKLDAVDHSGASFPEPLSSNFTLDDLRVKGDLSAGTCVRRCGIISFCCGCSFNEASGDIHAICIGHHSLYANCQCTISMGRLTPCRAHRPSCDCRPESNQYCSEHCVEVPSVEVRDPFDKLRALYWIWREEKPPLPRRQRLWTSKPQSGSNYCRMCCWINRNEDAQQDNPFFRLLDIDAMCDLVGPAIESWGDYQHDRWCKANRVPNPDVSLYYTTIGGEQSDNSCETPNTDADGITDTIDSNTHHTDNTTDIPTDQPQTPDGKHSPTHNTQGIPNNTQPHTPHNTAPKKYTIRVVTPIMPNPHYTPGHDPAFQPAPQGHLITPVTRKQLLADALVQPTRSGPGPGPQPLNDTLPSSSSSWSQLAPQEHLITPVTRKQLPADALVQPTLSSPGPGPDHTPPSSPSSSSSSSWFQLAPQEHLMTPVTKNQLPADALVQPTHAMMPSSSPHKFSPKAKAWSPQDRLTQPSPHTGASPGLSYHQPSPTQHNHQPSPQDRLTQPSPHTGPSPGLSYQQPSHTQHYHQPSHQHLTNLISSLLYVLHSPQSCASPSYSSHSYASPAYTQVAQPVTSSWGHDWAPDSYYHSEYAY